MVKIEVGGVNQQQIQNEIDKFLRNIGHLTKEVEQLKISSYSIRERENKKIGLSAILVSKAGILQAKNEGWELIPVVNELFEKLERQVKRKTKKD